MLIGAVRAQTLRPGAKMLDLCAGSGAVGVAGALRGAAVTAVDVSRRALFSAQLNARVNGVRVRARRGDLFAAVAGECFDLIATNPPYVPAAAGDLPSSGRARAWDASCDGRALLEPICSTAHEHLRPGGALLVIHSEVCGVQDTKAALASHGLRVDVVLRHRGPLGPILRERASRLWDEGRLPTGSMEEEIVIVRGTRMAGC